MKPTIGRIVYYYDMHKHARPAIVTVVHPDEKKLDLAVFFPDRQEFKHNIYQDEDHESQTWDWMPYQKMTKWEKMNNE